MTLETLAEGWRTCPGCGETYQRLSRHWTSGSCPHPQLSTHQRAVVTGILLGSGSIQGNGENKHLLTSTPHLDHAVWVAEQLGWLTHSLKRKDYPEGHRYLVRTHAHPTLTRYRDRWYAGESEKQPPGGLDLLPTVGRVWWADAGGLQWHGDYDSQRTGTWSAEADAKARRIQRVLGDAGFDATRTGKRVQLQGAALERWLDWVEEPVPGVGYKWATSRGDYESERGGARVDRLQAETWGDGDIGLSLYPPGGAPVPSKSVGHRPGRNAGMWEAWARMDWRAHLRAAVAAVGTPLTQAQYGEYRRTYVGPSAEGLYRGGGAYESWRAACADAGVQHGGLPSEQTPPNPEYSLMDIAKAVCRVRNRIGAWPSGTEYDREREEHDPASSTIYVRLKPEGVPGWSGWDVAVMLAERYVEDADG